MTKASVVLILTFLCFDAPGQTWSIGPSINVGQQFNSNKSVEGGTGKVRTYLSPKLSLGFSVSKQINDSLSISTGGYWSYNVYRFGTKNNSFSLLGQDGLFNASNISLMVPIDITFSRPFLKSKSLRANYSFGLSGDLFDNYEGCESSSRFIDGDSTSTESMFSSYTFKGANLSVRIGIGLEKKFKSSSLRFGIVYSQGLFSVIEGTYQYWEGNYEAIDLFENGCEHNPINSPTLDYNIKSRGSHLSFYSNFYFHIPNKNSREKPDRTRVSKPLLRYSRNHISLVGGINYVFADIADETGKGKLKVNSLGGFQIGINHISNINKRLSMEYGLEAGVNRYLILSDLDQPEFDVPRVIHISQEFTSPYLGIPLNLLFRINPVAQNQLEFGIGTIIKWYAIRDLNSTHSYSEDTISNDVFKLNLETKNNNPYIQGNIQMNYHYALKNGNLLGLSLTYHRGFNTVSIIDYSFIDQGASVGTGKVHYLGSALTLNLKYTFTRIRE